MFLGLFLDLKISYMPVLKIFNEAITVVTDSVAVYMLTENLVHVWKLLV